MGAGCGVGFFTLRGKGSAGPLADPPAICSLGPMIAIVANRSYRASLIKLAAFVAVLFPGRLVGPCLPVWGTPR